MIAALASSLAYIGPGAGLGAIAVTIALVLGAVLLLAGLVWYPAKRVIRSRKVEVREERHVDVSG